MLSSMSKRAATTPRTPIGTLMKKIQLQWISVKRLPTIGPTASASAETPAQTPIAVPRCRGGKVAVMIESVAGFIRAAPMPWTARAVIKSVALPASPHQSEAPVKTTRPATKIARRPSRSASFPPLSSKTPKVSAALSFRPSGAFPSVGVHGKRGGKPSFRSPSPRRPSPERAFGNRAMVGGDRKWASGAGTPWPRHRKGAPMQGKRMRRQSAKQVAIDVLPADEQEISGGWGSA